MRDIGYDNRLERFEAAVERFDKAIDRLERVMRSMPKQIAHERQETSSVVECRNCSGLGHEYGKPCSCCRGAGVQRI